MDFGREADIGWEQALWTMVLFFTANGIRLALGLAWVAGGQRNFDRQPEQLPVIGHFENNLTKGLRTEWLWHWQLLSAVLLSIILTVKHSKELTIKRTG